MAVTSAILYFILYFRILMGIISGSHSEYYFDNKKKIGWTFYIGSFEIILTGNLLHVQEQFIFHRPGYYNYYL